MFNENKKLIVGLGNIGANYLKTRHNIGFIVVDQFASLNKVVFQTEKLASVANFRSKNKQVIIIKPSTYMNLSGKAVSYFMEKEKIDINNILVVTDDIAIDLGQIRIRKKGGAGGHNGLQSIIDELSTTEFSRLRVGVGNNFAKGQQSDYLLSKWNELETDEVKKIIDYCTNICDSFVKTDIDLTMNLFNKKSL